MTQLDCISHLLGLDISFDHMQHKIYISTQSKIEELLVKTNMSNATPAATPASGGERFLKSDCANTDEDKKEMAAIPYRSIVASCLWIAINSRPDILFVVVMLAKLCENPGIKHWKQLKRVFCATRQGRVLCDGRCKRTPALTGCQPCRKKASSLCAAFPTQTGPRTTRRIADRKRGELPSFMARLSTATVRNRRSWLSPLFLNQ